MVRGVEGRENVRTMEGECGRDGGSRGDRKCELNELRC